MPESKSRRKAGRAEQQTKSGQQPNPVWYKPVMFSLMAIGLLWVIVFYITEATFPLPTLGSWNIMIGFGIAIVGFLMTTRWRS